jgi:tetratricopeptide (TPR) repeat protein
MPIKKTYYEILGVPRTATEAQIKRKYRQLVRTYHPDVAEDKAAAKAAFIEISEAYKALSNPDRRLIYDASLDAEMFKVPPRRPAPSSRPSTSRPRYQPSQNRVQVEELLRQAKTAFTHGQFRTAAWTCNQIQQLDARNVQAHVILGDIYRIQRRAEEAIAMYSIAVQLDPRNPEIQARLNRLVKQSQVGERRAALKMGLNLMGWSVMALVLMMLYMNPGEPIPWLRMNIALLDTWSTMLLAVLLIAGGLMGFILSVNETLDPLDDELVFQTVRSPNKVRYPIGLILIVFNLFNFYLAAAIYAIMGLVQENASKSVITALIATFILTALAAIVYTPGGTQVLLFGGNVTFIAVLFGWAFGDMFRPGW